VSDELGDWRHLERRADDDDEVDGFAILEQACV
jgi:hypothetical protein